MRIVAFRTPPTAAEQGSVQPRAAQAGIALPISGSKVSAVMRIWSV
jgi:hypothetical protein